jgi:hypothetical protein
MGVISEVLLEDVGVLRAAAGLAVAAVLDVAVLAG